MIVHSKVGLHGRTGNALYQIASTLGVAAARGDTARFPPTWKHRPWFSVPDRFFGSFPSDAVELERCSELAHLDQRSRIYAQDVNLFWPIIDEICSYFAPSPKAREAIDACTAFHALPRPVLSVHVRRGDNVYDPGVADKYNYYVLPPLDYYKRAIDIASHDMASIACFSDDIAWCRDNIGADYYHEGTPHPKENAPDFLTAPVLDAIDFHLMASADHHVVTGSTFGIMAAIASGDMHAVRPTVVYGPKLRYIDENLLFPPFWTRLETIQP